jgi:hypothetical protein
LLRTNRIACLLIVCSVVLCALLAAVIVFDGDRDSAAVNRSAGGRPDSSDASVDSAIATQRVFAVVRDQNIGGALNSRIVPLRLCLLI